MINDKETPHRRISDIVPTDVVGLPGYEAIQRRYDSLIGQWVNRIMPGEYCVARADEVLETLLGSCVAVCVRDPATKVGGMNHFLLPEVGRRKTDASPEMAERYGVAAMESLIKGVVKAGARRHALEAKVFGGARLLAGVADIGAKNIVFVEEWLTHREIPVFAHDVGGEYARLVRYFPDTGKAMVKRVASDAERAELAAAEINVLGETTAKVREEKT